MKSHYDSTIVQQQFHETFEKLSIDLKTSKICGRVSKGSNQQDWAAIYGSYEIVKKPELIIEISSKCGV